MVGENAKRPYEDAIEWDLTDLAVEESMVQRRYRLLEQDVSSVKLFFPG